MDDPCRRRGRHGNHLEQTAVTVGPDHEKAFLSLVLVLDQPQRMPPGMEDVSLVDPVPESRRPDLRVSTIS